MANRCVAFYTDNAAIGDIINRQTSKHQLVMILVRDLVLTSLKYNILFRARHIPSVHNSGADYISRFQVERFKQISPEADVLPMPVPANLLPQSWSYAKGLVKFRPVKLYQRAWAVFNDFYHNFIILFLLLYR